MSPYKRLIVRPQYVELQHIFAGWEFFTGCLCSALAIYTISYFVDRILPFPAVHMAYKSVEPIDKRIIYLYSTSKWCKHFNVIFAFIISINGSIFPRPVKVLTVSPSVKLWNPSRALSRDSLGDSHRFRIWSMFSTTAPMSIIRLEFPL